MEKTNEKQTQFEIQEDLSKNISLCSVNNFINWRSTSSVSTLDDLLIQLLFSHLKISRDPITTIELTELESLIKFVRDQKLIEEERDLD